MVIKGLRVALLLSLATTIGWLLLTAGVGETPRAGVPFANASLCIHRPGL